MFEIGREMALAAEAEALHRREQGDLTSPLDGVSYGRFSDTTGLHRHDPSSVDETIRSFVRGYAALPPAEQTRVRAALRMEDFYLLLTFARRCTVAALRNQDSTLTGDATIAIAAIDGNRVDYRDVIIATALLSYVAPPETLQLFRDLATHAEETVAGILLRFAEQPAEDLSVWGYRDGAMAEGHAFLEDWGAPYHPTADLVALAMGVAQFLEQDVYRVTSIVLGGMLPTVWLRGGNIDRSFQSVQGLNGCVVMDAELEPEAYQEASSQQLTTFIVEAASAASASRLADAAVSVPGDYEALARAAGTVCCIIVARSFVVDVPSFEPPGALERFAAPLSRILDSAVYSSGSSSL